MGLVDFYRKTVIKKFLKEIPIMGKLISWLSDPTAVGRKRTVASLTALLSGMIRGGSAALKTACESGDFVGALCKVDANLVATMLENVVLFLNTVVVPGADIVTILVGAWGLWAARNKTAIVVNK